MAVPKVPSRLLLSLEERRDSQTELAFVFGKARVAPMKPLTGPKLDLLAATRNNQGSHNAY